MAVIMGAPMLLSLVGGAAARGKTYNDTGAADSPPRCKIEVQDVGIGGNRRARIRSGQPRPESRLYPSARDRIDCGISYAGAGPSRSRRRWDAGRGRNTRRRNGARNL